MRAKQCSDNEIVKKTANDKLVAKVNNIDTSRFVWKSRYDTDKSNVEKKIRDADKKMPDTSGLVKKQILMLNHWNRRQNTWYFLV